MSIITDLAVDLFLTLLPFLAAGLVGFVFKAIGYQRVKLIREGFDTVGAWAWREVLSAQQKHWRRPGQDRYQIVYRRLLAKAQKHNISVTEEELDTAIEAAYIAMKAEFNKQLEAAEESG